MSQYALAQLRSYARQGARICRVDAFRMSEAAGTDSRASGRIGRDVINDVVGMSSIARYSAHPGEMVQSQMISDPPGDVMIRTGGVAAHSHRADYFLSRPVERQTSTENVHSTHLMA